MRKEFESGLAKRIAGKKAEKKVLGKAWIAVILGATLMVASVATVAAAGNMKGDHIQDQVKDQLKDGSCVEDALTESDGVCDGICDSVCDGVCDSVCDCTCPDCPCSDGTT